MTALFSPAVLAHVEVNAPALAGGAVDYGRILREYAGRVDFYDSREHLASLPGAALAAKVRACAGALVSLGIAPGDRIVMLAASDERYITALLAVLLLGAVPCAVAPPPVPSREDSAGVRHLRAAVRAVKPTIVLGPAAAAVALSGSGLPGAVVVDFRELEGGDPASVGSVSERRPARPADIHHVQLTSGSTSQPKAVVLTHANVAHQLGVLAHGMKADVRHDRMFSWLPLYHDMGLVQVLGGLVYGGPVALMSPLGFLRDPLSWLRHMTEHGSTITAGPTFAYRAVADAFGRASRPTGRIDLGALRHAFVGAEPIGYATLRHFTDTFAPMGLRPDALVPCYGMAESVLATTMALRPAPEGGDDFGRVRVVAAAEGCAPLVSCGPPIDGMRVSVVGSGGEEVPTGMVGEIRIGGPSLMAGYQESDGTLSPPTDGWHDTGDRGFVSDGQLFVVGRSKEMLIIRGRNLPPYDVEQTIGDMPEVGPGNAVVFSVSDEDRGRERIVAVLGTNAADTDDGQRVRAGAAARVREVFGFSLDEVVLVPRRAIPRTTSGKIQRLAVRGQYLADRTTGDTPGSSPTDRPD